MKIVAVVVTYYPNVEETTRNLLRFIDHVEALLIWENTPLKERLAYRLSFPGHERKVYYQGACHNRYIAFPLNQAIAYALEHGFTHLLAMDQDSCWTGFRHFADYVEAHPLPRAAAYTPAINGAGTEEPVVVEAAITSGTLYDVAVCREVGGFNETYQIDWVDTEYCFRARAAGYHIYRLPAGTLAHRRGNPSRVCGRWQTDNYSPERLYRIVRNGLLTRRAYPHYFNTRYFWKVTLRRIPLVLLGEPCKRRKLAAMLRGVLDAWKMNHPSKRHGC
ncbi:MAG: hypothetical protein LBM06_05945 [Prevotellaceae bacterium]|jgi:rhamnosyltransferase|nr:hypothetical protein [Prevotellaceae bacterium]